MFGFIIIEGYPLREIVLSLDDVIFLNHYISTSTVKFRRFCVRRPKVQHKQTSLFLVAVFVTLGILGILAAVAIPHASDMVYQSGAQERETELLKIRAAVDDMLRESPCGKLVSIGPVKDLALVHTADTVPLALTDYLPEEMKNNITSGCHYSFTSDGLVVQLTD